MSKEVPYQQSCQNNSEILLTNGREVKQFEFVDHTTLERGAPEEASTTRSITEQAIGCKIIASRLHHLEQGQKKILRTIVNLQPAVQADRMSHNKKGIQNFVNQREKRSLFKFLYIMPYITLKVFINFSNRCRRRIA